MTKAETGGEQKNTAQETEEEILEEEKTSQEDSPDKDQKEETESSKEGSEKAEETAPQKEEEDEDLKTKYLRLMADFQNYKRRAEQDRGMSYAFGKEELAVGLLPVIDNFERALEHEDNDEGTFKEGMVMIFKQFKEVLEKAGLKEIEALGLEFDPNVHNAVMTEDTDDYESNHVSEVMQKGYTLKDKVIRPSMVKVAN